MLAHCFILLPHLRQAQNDTAEDGWCILRRMICACREEQFCVYPFQSTNRCTLGCAGYALPIGQVLFSALPYLYFVRHGRVLSLYPLKPEDNQKGCFRTLACVLLSCASHPVEVTASVDIYPSRIVTSILFSRFL